MCLFCDCELYANDLYLTTACRTKVEVATLYEVCLYEVCACQDCECSVFEEYAKQCAEEGVTVDWVKTMPQCGK